MEPDAAVGFDWAIAASVAVAAATLVLAFVAVFGDWLKSLFRGSLELRLKNDIGTTSPAAVTTHDPSTGDVISSRMEKSRYYHVTASKPWRWSPVHRVRVYLKRVERVGADQKFFQIWEGRAPINWAHAVVFPMEQDIGPDREADLCSVLKDKWLALHPMIEMFSLDHHFRDEAHIRVTLQAEGTELDSNELVVEIHWDGNWSDDSAIMKSHCVVKQVSP